MQTPSPFAPIEEAIEQFRQGRIVIIVDDEDRENEGDLAIAAEKVTPAAINFMARYGRGLICLALTEERCRQLELPLMVEDNTSTFGTAFTVSIEARGKVTTGISAADRAATILTAIDPATRPEDLLRPGHVFPLRARRGGVLKRAGQTEASVDLAALAGLNPSGVICEIMNDDGTMARVPDLTEFAREHGLLDDHGRRPDPLPAAARDPGAQGRRPAAADRASATSEIHAYHSDVTGDENVALVMGDIDPEEPTLVRVHSQCLTGDVFGSARCDCGVQLERALEKIAEEGKGVLLYLLQEGRGIGLMNKLRAYELQEQGHDTVEANERLGFRPDHPRVRRRRPDPPRPRRAQDAPDDQQPAASTSPSNGYGLEIVERVPLEVPPTENSRAYLQTKRDKLGHLLKLV